MDDKVKVMRLYEKMTNINNNLYNLIGKIDYLTEALKTSLIIDDQPYKVEKIESNKSNVVNTKSAVKYTIINDLKKYL